MTDTLPSRGRRSALRLMAASIVAVPLAQLTVQRTAGAADLPHLSEDDPAAKGLQYVHDATKAKRVDKAGTQAEKQLCSTCQLIQGDAGEWRPCNIFPGRAVNASGWCTAWAPRA